MTISAAPTDPGFRNCRGMAMPCPKPNEEEIKMVISETEFKTEKDDRSAIVLF
jgi:hypothetical protein